MSKRQEKGGWGSRKTMFSGAEGSRGVRQGRVVTSLRSQRVEGPLEGFSLSVIVGFVVLRDPWWHWCE